MLSYNKKFLLMATVAGALAFPTISAQAEVVSETKVKATKHEDAKIVRTYGYDTNNNGFIENDEMVSYVYRLTDKDNDGVITSDELDTSYAMTYYANQKDPKYMIPEEKQKMSYWDKDKDNELDATEMETLVSDVGIYKRWDYDADGRVSVSELSTGTFNAYDDNKDGMISKSEWKDVIR